MSNYIESTKRKLRSSMYNFSELITSHVVIKKQAENTLVKPIFLLQHRFADNSFLAMYLHQMLKL